MKPISSTFLWLLIGVATLPLLILPLFQYLAIASFGSEIFLWLTIFVLFPLPVAGVVLILTPFLFFSRRLRPAAFRSFLAAVVFITAVLLGVQLGGPIRRAAFHRLAERSTPLVNAIKDYTDQNGQPPATLSALVPEFLPAVPETGIAAYPRYDYHVGEKALLFNGNPWVLSVFTPAGMINFDQFLYFPLQNYPETGYGGSLERISDWAYVHE